MHAFRYALSLVSLVFEEVFFAGSVYVTIVTSVHDRNSLRVWHDLPLLYSLIVNSIQ